MFSTGTPVNGLRDVFGTVSAKVWHDSLTLSGVYHDYSDDTGQQHYGDEWDFQAVKKFGKHYSVMAKYAYYNADRSDGYLTTFFLKGLLREILINRHHNRHYHHR